jgi:hypothetical protein
MKLTLRQVKDHSWSVGNNIAKMTANDICNTFKIGMCNPIKINKRNRQIISMKLLYDHRIMVNHDFEKTIKGGIA